MNRRWWLRLASLAFGFSVTWTAQVQGADAEKPREGGYRILMVTQSAGFKHGSVTRKEGKLSPAEQVVTEMGIRSNLFRVDCTQDVKKDFTKDNLKNYDIVWFYTTGDLPIEKADLEYFFNDWLKQKGHGFIGTHSAADTYHNYQPYWDMIGGTFNGHPWGSGETVTVTVHDKKHPASKPWGDEFEIKDEIYQFREWARRDVHVLLRLDARSVDAARGKRADGDYALAWTKAYGRGRVVYTALGHDPEIWADARFRSHLAGAIGWALGGP